MLLAFPSHSLATTSNCLNDAHCTSACISGNGATCAEAFCNTGFGGVVGRCDCSGNVLMRGALNNASCEAIEGATPNVQCEPAFRVTFNVAGAPTPEITAQDVQTNQPSEKLGSLVSLGVASALKVGLNEVVVSNLTLESSADAAGANESVLLIVYDLIFEFCSSRAVASVDKDLFQADFTSKVQFYAAFSVPATVAMLEFLNLTSTPSTSASSPSDPWGGVQQPEPSASASDGSEVFSIILLVAVVLLLAVTLAVAVWAKSRRHTNKVSNHPQADLEAPDADVERVLAHVACAFSPTDVEDDKVFRESCLDLSEGDIVEVIAGGGGWFYGRTISASSDKGGSQVADRMGYFPENRVSWVGKIPRVSEEVTSADQHALVSVDLGFSPQDVEEGGETMREHCLQVEAGELVEVLAGGAGWLYGQVAGHPERAGYFPENRANWLSATAENKQEAARTQQGVLVKVVQDFAPGSPGDKEEEAAFADSCLALAQGDVVEVAASGGGWVYGRVVGAPDRHGYFPETRVSWLGRPVAGSEPTSPNLSQDEYAALREAAAAAVDHPEAIPDAPRTTIVKDEVATSIPASPTAS